MNINFDEIPAKDFPRFRDGEGLTVAKMFIDDLGKIMVGHLKPGSTIGYHKHETSSEIIYILSGTADFLYDDGKEQTLAGQCHYCPKGHSHSMINNGSEDIVFFAVVPEQ